MQYFRSHATCMHRGEVALAGSNSTTITRKATETNSDDDNDYRYQIPAALPVLHNTICYDIFNFYNEYNDFTITVYNTNTCMHVQLSDISSSTQQCIKYVCKNVMSIGDIRNLYKHIVSWDASLSITAENSLRSDFPTDHSFIKYCDTVHKYRVVDIGWVTVYIQLPNCPPNKSGCFTCPLNLMKQLLHSSGGPGGLIKFSRTVDECSDRTY